MKVFVLLTLALLCLTTSVLGVAVISVDLGNDFYKVGIVKPGIPMEIVLNTESKRKTPTVVTIKSDERLFGDPALNAGIRKPQFMFTHFLDLVGKPFEHAVVEQYKSRFPHHNLVPTDRNTVQFKVDAETYYTVEELLAMILNNSRNIANDFAGEPVTNVIVTVPGFYTQAERKAVMDAVELSGLKLLQLMSDHTAVALNYGIFRRDEFKEAPSYMMFYDMGSSSTKASIVEYKTESAVEGTIKEAHPTLQIKGFGYDRSLGGAEFDFRLRDYLADQFAKTKKTSTPIKESPKAMAKLLKEATRVKQVLSANVEHYAQIEGLHEDQDFKAQVTRQKLDELCSDLYDRVGFPIEMALKTADLTMESIDYFIVFGGSFRVPKVQEKISEAIGGKDISKNINADEAAALGAVYQAAHLSAAFRVKKFIVKDASIFPIDVSFDRAYTDEDGSEKIKSVDRTVFNQMNVVPQKKVMTFSRMKDDFSFLVKYAHLDFLPEQEKKNFPTSHLLNVAVSGVKDTHDKHIEKENITDKGVKAHFRIDESGILHLLSMENTFEQKVIEEKEVPAQESTFSKLTSKIGSFFSGGSSDSENATKEGEAEPTEEKPISEEAKEPGDASEKKEEAAPSESAEGSEATATNETKPEPPKEKKLEEKIVPIKESVEFSLEVKDMTPLGETAMKESKDKLLKLTIRDMEKLETAKSLNDLESYIIGEQEKLDSENYQAITTGEEREKLLTMLSAASEWLYDEGIGLTSVEYKAKLKDLKTEFKGVSGRLFEISERPKAFEALRDVLNRSQMFLNMSANLPEDLQIFTEVEMDTLGKAINESVQFISDSEEKLAAASPQEMPPVLAIDIINKAKSLDRELQYLVGKMRYAKPKTKPTEKPPAEEKEVEEDNEDTETDTSDGSSSESDSTPEAPTSGEDSTAKTSEDSNTPNPEL